MSDGLEVEGLSTGYGAAMVVRDVSMSLKPGEVTCLLGRNGAGKSTIVRAVMGLLPRTGRVLLDGRDISRWRGNRINRAGVVCMPQGFDIIEGLSVLDHFRLAGHGQPADHLLTTAAAMFGVLGERGDQDASTLSGGERKMLGIALALCADPAVILMDEPTEGVAPVIVERLVSVLQNLETTASVLIVEQNLDAALGFGGHAYVLETGTIVEQGNIEKLSESGVLEERLSI